MDTPTRILSRYVRDKGINLSKMSRETGIPYMSLYDSLLNENRDRDLRVGEFIGICGYLEVNPMNFTDDTKSTFARSSKTPNPSQKEVTQK